MSRNQDVIFVLWGERFNETAAVTFVATLREIGLRVKLVGLTPPPIAGERGLTLVPDMLLDEAVLHADHAISIIIPASANILRACENDPRVQDLFCRASTVRTRFFIEGWEEPDTQRLALFRCTSNITAYPTDDLQEFVRNLSFALMGYAFEV